jgi:hypothetical protein
LSKQARGKMLTAAAMLVVAGLSTAQAADTTLTLACQGTVRIDDWSYRRAGQPQDTKPEPYSMGMTVNLTAHTVQGFGSNYPYKITDINAGTIIFRHSGEQTAIVGQIDRVTGDLEATITDYLDVQKREISTESRYEMKCRPAQRMF